MVESVFSKSSRENALGPGFETPRDYNIDIEVEILCRYSNSRVPGDMCRLQYQTERDAIVPKNWY